MNILAISVVRDSDSGATSYQYCELELCVTQFLHLLNEVLRVVPVSYDS